MVKQYPFGSLSSLHPISGGLWMPSHHFWWSVAHCIPFLAACGPLTLYSWWPRDFCTPSLAACDSLNPIYGGMPTSLLSSSPNKEPISLMTLGVRSTLKSSN